jgi:GTP-binding protein
MPGIIVKRSDYHSTAVYPSQFPTDGRPEIVFAGKSNVGKSSLINAMLNRKSLARTSKQPGKTRAINFYDVEIKAGMAGPDEASPLSPPDFGGNGGIPGIDDVASIYFADLPGYGYAKVSKTESAKWQKMIEGYLKGRDQIKAFLLLLDIRHEPGGNDKMLYEWCAYYRLPVVLAATKSDKIKKSQIQRQLSVLRKALGSPDPPLAFSSETGAGRDALWGLIRAKLFG